MIKLKSVIILLHESWFIIRPHGHFFYAIDFWSGPWLVGCFEGTSSRCHYCLYYAGSMSKCTKLEPSLRRLHKVPRQRPWSPRNGSLCLVAADPTAIFWGRILHARKRQKPVRTPPPLDFWWLGSLEQMFGPWKLTAWSWDFHAFSNKNIIIFQPSSCGVEVRI